MSYANFLRSSGFILGLIVLGVPTPAVSQENDGGQHGWSVRLGAGVAYGPDYTGSDDYDATPIPMVDLDYNGRFFLGFPHGLGVNLLRGEHLTVGIALGYGGGRDNEGDLKPIGEVDDGALGRVFADYEVGPITLSASFSSALTGDNDGEKAELSAKVGGRMGKRWVYSFGPGLEWHSDDWNDAVFSLSSDEAARFGVSPYQARGGLANVTVGGSLTRIGSNGWSVTLATGVSELLGDAADSPIVDELGDSTQASGVLVLGYRF